MTTFINFAAINANRLRAQVSATSHQISEISRIANELQKQGVTRTEALRIAESRYAEAHR